MIKKSDEKKILVIASAGGHLTQAMCATSERKNIVLISNKKNISDKRIRKIYQIWDTQHNIFIHFLNIFFATFVLLRERPSVVFSTGGPIALPFALICKCLPVKFIYLDTLSRVVELSNTGKLIKKYGLYDEFFCQWKNIATKVKAKYIGKCFDILCENEYQTKTTVCPEIPVILVTVGTNQYDFDRLFSMISKMPLYRDSGVKWVIQKGHNQLKTPPANAEIVDMISRDDMEALVKSASLVISHCGIGSINLMLSYQKKVFFVPRVAKHNEFSDDHQLQIANEIGSELFTIIPPEQEIPPITLTELKNRDLVIEPVDTTNTAMAQNLSAVFSE